MSAVLFMGAMQLDAPRAGHPRPSPVKGKRPQRAGGVQNRVARSDLHIATRYFLGFFYSSDRTFPAREITPFANGRVGLRGFGALVGIGPGARCLLGITGVRARHRGANHHSVCGMTGLIIGVDIGSAGALAAAERRHQELLAKAAARLVGKAAGKAARQAAARERRRVKSKVYFAAYYARNREAIAARRKLKREAERI